jgi:nucleoside-diphosphate-sugar epimerase
VAICSPPARSRHGPHPYVYNLAGFKFGASSQAEAMWAANTLLSQRIVERFHNSRIVYLSSGNVYPFTEATNGGASEDTTPDPVGEYAQSRLGGERLAAWGASEYGTQLLIVRHVCC